jgi:hypothetical protein
MKQETTEVDHFKTKEKKYSTSSDQILMILSWFFSLLPFIIIFNQNLNQSLIHAALCISRLNALICAGHR